MACQGNVTTRRREKGTSLRNYFLIVRDRNIFIKLKKIMEKKEVLQAVIVADNFSECFKPFSTFNSPVSKLFFLP